MSDALQVPTWCHQMTARRLKPSARVWPAVVQDMPLPRSGAGARQRRVGRRSPDDSGPAPSPCCLGNFQAGILTRVEMCCRPGQCSGTSRCGGETPSAVINRLEIDTGEFEGDFSVNPSLRFSFRFAVAIFRVQSGLLPHRSSQLSGFRGEGRKGTHCGRAVQP